MGITRRQWLAGALGIGAFSLVGGLVYRQIKGDAQEWVYELTAKETDIDLRTGQVTPAMTYNGQAPGPMLRARQGDWLRVRFHNQLSEPTTIHWHGIRLPLEMDGVPYVSQLPVQPGESFEYAFQVPDAGSFWYHPHVSSPEQLGRGLVGPIIVEERQPTGFSEDIALSLKNWRLEDDGLLAEPMLVPREAARAGTMGAYSTVNGQHQPTVEAVAGEIVRLRVLNLDSNLTYRLSLPNGDAQIYALDGNPIQPRPFKEWQLGPGMRIELGVKMPSEGQELQLRNGPLLLARLRSRGGQAKTTQWPAAIPANPIAIPDLQHAERLRFNFEWAGLVSRGLERGSHTFWQINGQAWDINDVTCAERPIATLDFGKSYIFELRNLSQYHHPIHLHGMTFCVLSSNRRKIDPWFTDTYLLGRNESAQIAFVADNPGVWMFHCHVVDHMDTGLMAAIEVV